MFLVKKNPGEFEILDVDSDIYPNTSFKCFIQFNLTHQ